MPFDGLRANGRYIEIIVLYPFVVAVSLSNGRITQNIFSTDC